MRKFAFGGHYGQSGVHCKLISYDGHDETLEGTMPVYILLADSHHKIRDGNDGNMVKPCVGCCWYTPHLQLGNDDQ